MTLYGYPIFKQKETNDQSFLSVFVWETSSDLPLDATWSLYYGYILIGYHLPVITRRIYEISFSFEQKTDMDTTIVIF